MIKVIQLDDSYSSKAERASFHNAIKTINQIGGTYIETVSLRGALMVVYSIDK